MEEHTDEPVAQIAGIHAGVSDAWGGKPSVGRVD